jgi:hypothetical protein
MNHITDEKGKWIGHVNESGPNKTYSDAKGNVVARVVNGRTLDAKGQFKGTGDQGLRFIGKSS